MMNRAYLGCREIETAMLNSVEMYGNEGEEVYNNGEPTVECGRSLTWSEERAFPGHPGV